MNETIAKIDHTIVNGTGVAEETGNNHLVYCSVCQATIKAEHDWKETEIEGTTKASASAIAYPGTIIHKRLIFVTTLSIESPIAKAIDTAKVKSMVFDFITPPVTPST